MDKTSAIFELLAVMRALRDPNTGCPWDIKQNFASIAPYTIEEAYEVADAVARGDMDDLRDELGDLLLQVVYHAQMAAEVNAFTFEQVAQSICEKMIRRHPHVFDENNKNSQLSDESLAQNWEQIKKQERKQQSQDHSVLAGVSVGLPPILRALKLQKKAALVNFDWSKVDEVIDKVAEELVEVKECLSADAQAVQLEEELGDLMFAVLNLSRHLKLDADIALQKANTKFERRFRKMEVLAAEQGQSLSELNIDQMDALWSQAKNLLDK